MHDNLRNFVSRFIDKLPIFAHFSAKRVDFTLNAQVTPPPVSVKVEFARVSRHCRTTLSHLSHAPLPSFPRPSTVVPAKAGTHRATTSITEIGYPPKLDARLRGHDGDGSDPRYLPCAKQPSPRLSIATATVPAPPRFLYPSPAALPSPAPLPSLPRTRESIVPPAPTPPPVIPQIAIPRQTG